MKLLRLFAYLPIASLVCLFSCVSTAAEPADGKVVFREGFESGLDRWQILDPATWQLTEHDGNHTLEITARESAYQPPHRSPLHIALVKDLELKDVQIDFRVRSTKDTGNHRDCCVFFAYQNDKHFYYVHCGAKPDPHSGQIMIVNDAPRLALTTNESPTPWDDQWHQVRLIHRGSTGEIAVYFDDMQKPLMATTDKTFAQGRIGIGSFDDMNEFDDIVVTELK